MNLSSLLYPATVRAHVQLDSKKALFPFVGDLAARSLGLDAGEVSEALLERERLGSTGFGRGIALPHAAEVGHLGVRQRDAAAEAGRAQTFAFEQSLADFAGVEAERTAGEIADEGEKRLFRIELNMRAHGRRIEKGRKIHRLAKSC